MKMTKKQAGERIKELREITAYHAKRYYDDDDPEISDFEYDMLMLELRNLENKYPEFISSESLTQHVGGTVKEGFEKVEHEVPLQSLLDIFNFEDLRAFDERVRKVSVEENIPLKYGLEVLSKGDNQLFNTKYVSLDKAIDLLNHKDISGYVVLGEDVKVVSDIDYVLGRYIDDYAFRRELKVEIVHVKVKKTCTDVLRAIIESIIHIFDNYLENSTKKIRIARWI